MARLQSEMTTDFSAGMVDGAAPTAYPRTAAARLINARIQPDGTLQRRDGTRRLHADALEAATGYGGASFTTAAGQDQLVVCFGAKAFVSEDSGDTWTEVQDNLREDYYSFVTMRVGATNYLLAANGAATIQRWDGTTWDTLPNAPSGVKYLAVFNGRLWVTGHSGVIVQASKIAAPTIWTSPDALTLQIIAHSGDIPTGLFQIGPHLLVFDRRATSYIDGFGEQTMLVATGATGFSRSVGCVGFRTICAVGDNAVCWMSERGVEYYSTSGGITLLTSPVGVFLQSIDWSELYLNPSRMSAAYDSIAQNYHLAISNGGARNNNILVLNISQQSQWQRTGPRAAASIDQMDSPVGGVLGFADVDGDGFLDASALGGLEPEVDGDGYMALAESEGDDISADVGGYLQGLTNDALPATLFTAPSGDLASALYSLGYDGFVRLHAGVESDDMTVGATGGTPVVMQVVTRPFLLGRARQRKRVRAIFVSAIHPEAMTVTVAVRGSGVQAQQHILSFPATALGQSCRRRALTHLVADEPQVEVYVANDAKISVVGLAAELLREPIG